MMDNPIHNLRADDLGRFVLDLETPAEKTIGRMLGCFAKIAAVVAFFMLLGLMSSDAGAFAKLARIAGLALVVGFFWQCWRNVDCYYVLDDVGGQLLYHFSAVMIVSEDPVANLEDIVGIGVTYGGPSPKTGMTTWALVFCHADGRVIRVSDFLEAQQQVNQIAENVAALIKVPCLPARAGERNVIAVENGAMVSIEDDSFISSVTSERATGCLVGLFVFPFTFYPALFMLMLPLMVISGKGTERNLEYFLTHDNYGVIKADGTLIPSYRRHHGPRIPARHVSGNDVSPQSHQSSVKTGKQIEESVKMAEQAPDLMAPFEKMLQAETASGTIVAGKGIMGLVEIGEEMQQVLPRFNRPVPVVEKPQKIGSGRSTFVPKRVFRDNLFDDALSLVFQADKSDVMRLARIEIFRGRSLPYTTPGGYVFLSDAQKEFGLIEERGDLNEEVKRELRRHGADVFLWGGGYGKNSRKGYGVEFRERGIALLFSGGHLDEIVITPDQAARRRWGLYE